MSGPSLPIRVLRAAAGAVAPPLCPLCRRPMPGDPALCPRCHRELWSAAPVTLQPPAGVGRAAAALSYEGSGRALVAALKFRRMLALASTGAELIEAAAARGGLEPAPIVPVPASPWRLAARGFDPAELLALALARLLGVPVLEPLRRDDRGRQARRRRADRTSRPPAISATGRLAGRLIVVDDVATTGVTLSAAALALRDAGASRVDAAVLARSPRGRSARDADWPPRRVA